MAVQHPTRPATVLIGDVNKAVSSWLTSGPLFVWAVCETLYLLSKDGTSYLLPPQMHLSNQHLSIKSTYNLASRLLHQIVKSRLSPVRPWLREQQVKWLSILGHHCNIIKKNTGLIRWRQTMSQRDEIFACNMGTLGIESNTCHKASNHNFTSTLSTASRSSPPPSPLCKAYHITQVISHSLPLTGCKISASTSQMLVKHARLGY